jgi:ornithine cyclodeaminase
VISEKFRTYFGEAVLALLDYQGCTDAVRGAMAALSASETDQPLRTILARDPDRLFGVMPGTLPPHGAFGAKLVSVFRDGPAGRSRHRGVVVLFDADTGAVVCVADAEAVTHVRTGCASAVATRALARPDARTLAVFGTGAQADSHIRAITAAQPIDRVLLWGRSRERAADLAERLAARLDIEIVATRDGRAAAARADIICTVSSAREPILRSEWVRPGTHINLVGSSLPGPVEVDTALVARARYFVDYRPAALAAASELKAAIEAGLVGENHIIGEIGDVLLGRVAGRTAADQVTIYKSLGHIVQDLAAVDYLDRRARAEGPQS